MSPVSPLAMTKAIVELFAERHRHLVERYFNDGDLPGLVAPRFDDAAFTEEVLDDADLRPSLLDDALAAA
ncbi:MAG: hypothetical protein Q8O67_21795 [Deltaproteobacteria bacterium]|nr:hypothetical protein [Deltaproteobacteria bacterium]